MTSNQNRATPAFSTFKRNMAQLADLMEFFDAQIAVTNIEVLPHLKAQLKKAKEDDDIRGMAEPLAKHLSFKAVVELQMKWYAVMLVTVTETYLQDVLSYCASLDQKLMKDSEQKATYAEIQSAESIEALAQELRDRWARNFLERGGPSTWIDKLSRIGARGYSSDLSSRMEQFWGIRHVIVHRAGIITTDFVKHHPFLGYSVGQTIRLTSEQIGDYSTDVINFAKTTDQFLSHRYLDDT